MKEAKIIGIIPARYASSRFKGKMLANILSKSLIQRTYENTKRVSSLDRVVVATDSKQIFDHVKGFGGEVYMTSECASGTDRVAELAKREFLQADIIVNVQGDEPCLAPKIVDMLVDALIKQKEALVTTPVAPIENVEQFASNSVVKCVFDKERRALYFSRSPIPYSATYDEARPLYRHIGVYAFRSAFLQEFALLQKTPLQEREDLEQLKILEHGHAIYVCPVATGSIGVDTPEDVRRVEQYLWNM